MIIIKILGKQKSLKLVQYLIDQTDYITNTANLSTMIRESDYDPELLSSVHQNMGILKHADFDISGEKFALENIVNKLIGNKINTVIFDVGANIGDYVKEVRRYFPDAHIYSFEPNPDTYKKVVENTSKLNISCHNLGFGATTETRKIYSYRGDQTSQLATLYPDAFLDLYKFDGSRLDDDDLIEFKFAQTTIDKFCKDENIKSIDFLKIDVEGHELEVLEGATTLISDSKINIIQFEFNEINVIARVFLRDFYLSLPNYDFFRIDTDKLIPLREYSSEYEIFRFQNILAVNKNISASLF